MPCRFLCIRQCLTELSENLVLAHDHRVDTGCEGKEVPQGPRTIMHEILFPAVSVQEVAECCLFSLDYHFHPVAGLEEEGSGKTPAGRCKELFFICKTERLDGCYVCRMMAHAGNRRRRIYASMRYLRFTSSHTSEGFDSRAAHTPGSCRTFVRTAERFSWSSSWTFSTYLAGSECNHIVQCRECIVNLFAYITGDGRAVPPGAYCNSVIFAVSNGRED